MPLVCGELLKRLADCDDGPAELSEIAHLPPPPRLPVPAHAGHLTKCQPSHFAYRGSLCALA